MTRAALITGAGTGIGASTALALAADGLAVALVGRRREPLEAVAREIGERAHVVVGRHRHRRARGIVEDAVDALGGLHVVVNNAGTIRRNVRLHELELETWHEQIAVNLTGHFLVLHAALPHLLRQRGRPLDRQRRLDARPQARARDRRLRRGQGRDRLAHAGAGGRVRPGRHPRQRGHARRGRDARWPTPTARTSTSARTTWPRPTRCAGSASRRTWRGRSPTSPRPRRRGSRGTIVDVDGGFSVT